MPSCRSATDEPPYGRRHHTTYAPAFSGFSPILLGNKPTPFWPAIPLIIACDSLSGFHSLVASGTSSKQLEKESDGLVIGYGSILFLNRRC